MEKKSLILLAEERAKVIHDVFKRYGIFDFDADLFSSKDESKFYLELYIDDFIPATLLKILYEEDLKGSRFIGLSHGFNDKNCLVLSFLLIGGLNE